MRDPDGGRSGGVEHRRSTRAEIATSGLLIGMLWPESGTSWLRPRVDKAA